MRLPASPYGVTSAAGLMDWLRTLVTSIAAGWAVEHTAEGRHNWNWTTPTFDATRFTGDGTVTWTVASDDRVFERYGLLGDLMHWTLQIALSSTGGTASPTLRVYLPDGYRLVGSTFHAAAYASDAGGYPDGVLIAGSNDRRYVEVVQQDGTNWSNAATNTTYLYFSIMVRVTR
jgi:hypothetical protein